MTTDTKTALLDSAEHASRARGFDGFSYADLAEAVGIRKASIHYHFPTKAALSAALMDRYHACLERTCAQIDSRHETAAGRLKALIDFYRDALNGGKTLCLCVSFIASRESLTDDVKAKISAFRKMMIDWIRDVYVLGSADKTIAGITDPAQEARATLALLEGAHLAARSDETIEVFDEAVQTLLSRCRP
ncbi:TetR/AcrR family transcriptional regulator [Roseibium sp.]|uniref:TetR/AcrR family transcriptional regulator n=1 Tax=Roseibium sp. TaxID=1936156 RepID=UPI003D111277